MSIFDSLSEQENARTEIRLKRAAKLRDEFDQATKRLASLFRRYEESLLECHEVGVEMGFNLDPMLEAAWRARETKPDPLWENVIDMGLREAPLPPVEPQSLKA